MLPLVVVVPDGAGADAFVVDADDADVEGAAAAAAAAALLCPAVIAAAASLIVGSRDETGQIG